MSNVDPAEIVCLTAKAFGLLPTAFRGRFCGKWSSLSRPHPLVARQVAVYLIKRHTLTRDGDICALLGLLGRPERYKLAEQAKVIERDLQLDERLRRLVSEIEDCIDALHDERSRDFGKPPKPPFGEIRRAREEAEFGIVDARPAQG